MRNGKPMMRSSAEALIYRLFIDKFAGKGEPCIGVEIEMPVVNLACRAVETGFIAAMLDLLKQRFAFTPTRFDQNGFPIEAVNPRQDAFSFETTFNTIEFAMAKKPGIDQIAANFYSYVTALQELAHEHHHLICGMGINPYAAYADSKPLNSPVMLAKAEFLKNFTSHHDGEIFHAFSAACQTHLDVELSQLPDLLNLLGKLAFVDAMLFANSLPFAYAGNRKFIARLPASLQREMAHPTLCFRDILWRLCEAPNIRPYDRDYASLEEVVKHLLDLKIFIISDGSSGFKAIPPVRFADYIARERWSEADLSCFRSLEPVAVSRHGTVEIRQTCTQPLADSFAPAAFYTGIAENITVASELVHDFWQDNQINISNSQLRRQAVSREMATPADRLREFINNLLAIAAAGLKKRKRGEDKYLGRFLKPDHEVKSPAQRQLDLLQEGWSFQEIMLACSALDESGNSIWANDMNRGKGEADGLPV